MPNLDLRTQVVIFMQYSEFSLLTNTGVLAHRILKNSKMVFRGHPRRASPETNQFSIRPDNTFILYPSPGAIELNHHFTTKHPGALTLICPDGHWGQAKRIVRREPSLRGIRCVKLPDGLVSHYQLRRNQQDNHVCTMEAIMLALGIIEGQQIQKTMEGIFNRFVSRLLWVRGKNRKEQIIW